MRHRLTPTHLAALCLLAGPALWACKDKAPEADVSQTIPQERPADLSKNIGWVRTERTSTGDVALQLDRMDGIHAPHREADALGEIDWQPATAELEAGSATVGVRWLHGGGALRDVTLTVDGTTGGKGHVRAVLRPLMGTIKAPDGEVTARVELDLSVDLGDADATTAVLTGAGTLEREADAKEAP